MRGEMPRGAVEGGKAVVLGVAVDMVARDLARGWDGVWRARSAAHLSVCGCAALLRSAGSISEPNAGG